MLHDIQCLDEERAEKGQDQGQVLKMLVDSNDRVQKRPIVLGISGANSQEVTSGLQPGDRVIIGGQSELQPGQQVTPQPAKSDLENYQQTNQKGGQ